MLRTAISSNCGPVEVVRIMGKGSKARRAKRRDKERDGQSEERKKEIYLKSTMESEERKTKAYLKHTVEKKRFI